MSTEPTTRPWFWAHTARRDRLAALAAYDLVNPLLREQLDAVATAVTETTGHPTSLINAVLTDVQMTIGSNGAGGWIADVGGTPAEWAFCLHVVLARGPFVVPDSTAHPIMASSPLTLMGMTNSYAGVPVIDPQTGEVIGALCVIDDRPGACGERDVPTLNGFAGVVAGILGRYRREE